MSRWGAIRAALNGQTYIPHTVVSINGMGSGGDGPGFACELGDVVTDSGAWDTNIKVAYPAAAFPMGPSVRTGIENTIAVLRGTPRGKLALMGYSEGALVMNHVWRDHILNPVGELHYLLPDIAAIVLFGDPMRAPGICNGNLRAGFPIPRPVDGFTTGGIAGPDDLTPEQTPPFLMSCNNDGDLYGAAPVGDTPWVRETGVGHDETLIYNLVQDFDGRNVLAFVQEAMAILGVSASGGVYAAAPAHSPSGLHTGGTPAPGIDVAGAVSLVEALIAGAPLGLGGIASVPATGATTPAHVIALIEALWNGGMFVVRGLGPHGDYEKFIPAMAAFVNERAT